MTTLDVPVPPEGAGEAGRRIWLDVLERYELEEHELALLREAVRTVDLLRVLADRIAGDGAVLVSKTGVIRINPAVIEARQQRIALARVLAALRLPAGEEGDEQAGARRPQRRVGARGVYGVRVAS